MRAEISNKINLKLECTAIGSLPHTNANEAMELVKSNFSRIPFWPQLVKVNKNEDMIFQFLEGMPSFFCEDNKIFLDTEYETFCEDFEEFFKLVLEEGENVLQQTPEMLPVLKKAGVVDAGGYGFVLILKGMLSVMRDGVMIKANNVVAEPEEEEED